MIIASLPREYYSKWTEISETALLHNFAQIRAAVQASTRVMAVVKANAYGHNVSIVAPLLWGQGVRDFGVATLVEARYLQDILPSAKILILGALTQAEYHKVIAEQLTFIVSTVEHIQVINRLAEGLGKRAYVHLKVDTGMGRVGIDPADFGAALTAFSQAPAIKLEGICSHLATSDIPQGLDTARQLAMFAELVAFYRSQGLPPVCFHLANSDAIFQYPEAHYDMVRPGIALYGYSSCPEIRLQPVLALQGKLTQLKQVPAGMALGYGRTFTTERLSRIGVVPIGYADGLSRLLSNRQVVLVAGQRVPLVGRISMDQCLVDLTEVGDLPLETPVTFIGRQGSEQITAQDWALKLQTISYEVLTSLGTRLPRYQAA